MSPEPRHTSDAHAYGHGHGMVIGVNLPGLTPARCGTSGRPLRDVPGVIQEGLNA